jgi:hypothetical protein
VDIFFRKSSSKWVSVLLDVVFFIAVSLGFAMSNYYGTDLKNLRATGFSCVSFCLIDLRLFFSKARTVLIDLCKGELLLILRQVPGKQVLT